MERVDFKKQAYAVYFIKAETKKLVLDSVFLSRNKAMRYAEDYNEWEENQGSKDIWICQPIDFDDEK